MGMDQTNFGELKNGESATLLSLTNNNGMRILLTNYGACLVSVMAPDKNGVFDDVVLGFDDAGSYESDGNCFGSTIGRNANRTGGAVVEIEGASYELPAVEGRNNLHSLPDGYHLRLWDFAHDADKQSIAFKLVSEDMDQGFPGRLEVSVVYTLTNSGEIIINYNCICDRTTIVNMTNHSYFNLAGHASGDVLDHVLSIDSKHFNPIDGECIPTGEIHSVAGTPFDFVIPKKIGRDIDQQDEQLKLGSGYDHNFVLNDDYLADTKMRLCAVATASATGRVLEVFTDQPAVQLYTGNHIKPGTPGKNGAIYSKRAGFCLETQYYPDANHHPDFPSTILPAGMPYRQTTIYKFSTVDGE